MEPQTPPEYDFRILAISDAAPSRNGAGSYYQDLVELLRDSVSHIELYSPYIDENGQWQAGFVLPLPGDKTQRLGLPNVFRLRRLINECRPDIVLIATPGLYGLCGTFFARRRGIPVLVGMHTSFEQLTELYWPDSIAGKIVEKFFRCSNGYLFRRAESVLGNSEDVLEQAREMGASRVRLVDTPVSAVFSRPPVEPYRGEFDRSLFAGRLAREKNIEQLLATVESMPGHEFSVAGDGPLRGMVEAAVKKYPNLDYLGWLGRPELREAIDYHDCLLLPSHFETFGTIALEAMARQRLVVVSRGCGISRWPQFQPGLTVIDPVLGLRGTLDRIGNLSAQERRRMAVAGYKAAVNVNDRARGNWLRLIAETVDGFPGGSG